MRASKSGGHLVHACWTIDGVMVEGKGRRSAFTKSKILVVAAGGIFDGRGLASALALGAHGVW